MSEAAISKHISHLAKELEASIPGLAGRCAVALGHAGLRKPLPLAPSEQVRCPRALGNQLDQSSQMHAMMK